VTKTQLVRLALLDGLNPIKNPNQMPKTASKVTAEEQLRTANSTVKLPMLRSAVEYGTSHMEHLKAQENKSLQRFTVQEAGHKKRQAHIDECYHNKTLIAEFFQSNTKEESRQWGSWGKNRDRQHQQYQSSMKIQQDAITNAKLLIDAYTSNSAQLKGATQSMASFVHEAWAEVKKQEDLQDNALPAVLL